MMRPNDETELAEAIRGADGPLAVRGGGTRAPGPMAGTFLDTGGLSGVVLHEPGALTLVARAGTALSEVEALLAAQGQRLPFEPPDLRGLLGRDGNSTLGGIVAANASGPRRVQGGACRDFLIGVRFVDGSGNVVKNGGRVMKNVTGYDLVKLMAGSHGTLGVLSELSFKLLPAPEAEATLAVEGLDAATAVAAMSAALGTPWEVSGVAHRAGGTTWFRIEGFAAAVGYRAARLSEALARFGAPAMVEDSPAVWRAVRDVAAFHGREGDVWRLSVRPSEAPAVSARADALDSLFDWGGARLWLLMPPGTDLRPRLGSFEGHATLLRAAPETIARLGAFPPEPDPVRALSSRLRRQFDPRGLLNPGLMG